MTCRTWPRSLFRVAGLCSMWLAVMSVPAYAQDDAFKRGMEARDDRRWPEVEKQMRAAIQANTQESNRKVSYGRRVLGIGGKNADYLPHFYLGEALFNRQDCVGAMDAWAASERQGAIRANQELFKVVQSGYAACETRGVLPPGKFDPLVLNAQQRLQEAIVMANQLAELGKQNPEPWADVRDPYIKASTEIEAARDRLASGAKSRTAKELNDAAAGAERAKTILVAAQASLKAAVDRVQSAQNVARDVEQALKDAEGLDQQITARLQNRTLTLSPALGATRREGREALDRGNSLRATGIKSADANMLTDARSLGQRAASRFGQVLDELTRLERGSQDRQLNEARTSAAQASRLLEELFTTLDRRLAANPTLPADVTAERDAVRRQAEATRRRLDAATKAANLPAIAQATRATSETRDRVSALIARFGPITLRERGVSQALEEGVGQFLGGQYRQALSTLNPAEGVRADDPLKLHVHLFRAAALYALFAQSRAADKSLEAQARTEVEECKKLDSAFAPNPQAFSPAFIAFFRGDTATPRQ